MSIVLTGGNDRIATRYKDIFKSYKYKAKVFTQMPPYFENKLGKHAIMVVFINTCSHKMINTVNQRSAKHNIPVIKSYCASVTTLK